MVGQIQMDTPRRWMEWMGGGARKKIPRSSLSQVSYTRCLCLIDGRWRSGLGTDLSIGLEIGGRRWRRWRGLERKKARWLPPNPPLRRRARQPDRIIEERERDGDYGSEEFFKMCVTSRATNLNSIRLEIKLALAVEDCGSLSGEKLFKNRTCTLEQGLLYCGAYFALTEQKVGTIFFHFRIENKKHVMHGNKDRNFETFSRESCPRTYLQFKFCAFFVSHQKGRKYFFSESLFLQPEVRREMQPRSH